MTPLLERLPGPEEPLAWLSACHRRIARHLDTLRRAAVVLGEPRHERTDEAREAVRAVERYFREAAPRHAEDEERSLFPRLLERVPGLQMTLLRLDGEHRELDRLHLRLERIVQDLERAGAARDLAALVADLEALYPEHIRIEEEEVLPCAEQALDPAELTVIGREMAARRAPPPAPAATQRRR